MSAKLMETLQSFYRLLAAGRLDDALDLLAPDIRWQAAAGFPGIGGLHRGTAAVRENVFARLARDWAEFAVAPERWIASENAVVALGRYQGAYRNGSRRLDAPFVHIWDSEDGKQTDRLHPRFRRGAGTRRHAGVKRAGSFKRAKTPSAFAAPTSAFLLKTR